MTQDDSEQLIARAKSGEDDAIESLIRRHIAGLRVFVRARVDPIVEHQESTSDLVQTVCREAIENLDKYEWQGEGSFRNWLFTVALNKLRDRKKFYLADRRDVTRKEIVSIDGLRREDLAHAYLALTSPSQQAIREELVDTIHAALQQMPGNHREVILLSRIVGMTHEEIAVEMDTTPGNVRVLLHRALARLAGALHPAED